MIRRVVTAAVLWNVLPFVAVAENRITVSTSGFTQQQARHVREALDTAMQRWLKKSVVDCLYSQTTRHWDIRDGAPIVFDRGDLKTGGLGLFLEYGIKAAGLRWNNARFNIHIQGVSMGNGKNGRAPVGYDGVKKDLPEYSIELNTDNVDRRTASQVGGTIWHEMLHNYGETHGSSGNYDNDYKGYMIKEWGHCIAGNGVPNFGLTGGADADPYARWAE